MKVLVHRLANGVAVALAATALTLGLTEVGLRLFSPDLADEPIARNPFQFYQYDPVLGWATIPGARGAVRKREYLYRIRINSHGLRGPEISLEKPPGVHRIAVIGDSFTWGIGIDEPQLFTSQIERRIPRTQVLNFGVSGYGPIQYYLETDKVLRFDPDLVVIAFCLGNDFADNVFWERYRYYKPFARFDEKGELVIDGYPLPNVKWYPTKYDGGILGALQDRFYLFRLIDKSLLVIAANLANFGQKGPSFSEDQSDIYAERHTPEVDYVIRVNASLMQRIVDVYLARDIPVIVLAVPTKCEFGRCFSNLTSPTDAARRALLRSLKGLSVVVVDPTPQITLADYWEQDSHLRQSGQDKLADALVPPIIEQLSAPGSK